MAFMLCSVGAQPERFLVQGLHPGLHLLPPGGELLGVGGQGGHSRPGGGDVGGDAPQLQSLVGVEQGVEGVDLGGIERGLGGDQRVGHRLGAGGAFLEGGEDLAPALVERLPDALGDGLPLAQTLPAALQRRPPPGARR